TSTTPTPNGQASSRATPARPRPSACPARRASSSARRSTAARCRRRSWPLPSPPRAADNREEEGRREIMSNPTQGLSRRRFWQAAGLAGAGAALGGLAAPALAREQALRDV